MDVREESVEPQQWHARCRDLVAGGAGYPDFLTAVDHPEADQIELVAHLVDVVGCARHLVRTRLDRGAPQVDSIVDVLPGMSWHERETAEMFGVTFRGSGDPRPLLTTGIVPPPLLRTTPLPARVQTPWPGARDPADRPATTGRAARPRTAPVPPGVPAEWSR